MRPILFEIGHVAIYSYGFMLALGFSIATFLAMRCAGREGIKADKILDLALFILITGIIGARLFYVSLNWSDFRDTPINIFFLNRGGLAIYGGFAFSIPLSVWFIKKKSMPFWRTADIASPHIALAQSFGRIGCFLNGCCYGKPTDLFLGVTFPMLEAPRHPTQLYSAAGLLLIFFILKYCHHKRRFDGQPFLLYLILYSSFRFAVEILRGDSQVFIFGLTLFQVLSAVLFMVSVTIYMIRMRGIR